MTEQKTTLEGIKRRLVIAGIFVAGVIGVMQSADGAEGLQPVNLSAPKEKEANPGRGGLQPVNLSAPKEKEANPGRGGLQPVDFAKIKIVTTAGK